MSTSPPPPSNLPSAKPHQPRTQTNQSFGFPDTDPWASPDLHRGHNHGTNGQSNLASPVAAPPALRTTSSFTTRSGDTGSNQPAPPTRQSTSSNDVGWGYNAGPPSSFRDTGIGEGFGQPSGGGEGSDPTGLGAPLPRITPSGPEEVITVTSLPEKEGMFLFQHRNYQVTSARRNSKVIRRYSDFVWLLDCLHKRYPFRQLPLLPPKRVASKSCWNESPSSPLTNNSQW